MSTGTDTEIYTATNTERWTYFDGLVSRAGDDVRAVEGEAADVTAYSVRRPERNLRNSWKYSDSEIAREREREREERESTPYDHEGGSS
jgi:hypothetical protein